jgi:hypothetical protein
MQTTTSKSSEAAPTARVVRIFRSPRQRRVPSAAIYKPEKKWTVVIAFILAVALHAGAVTWVEMQEAKPTLEAGAPVHVDSMKGVVETGGTGTADVARAAD